MQATKKRKALQKGKRETGGRGGRELEWSKGGGGKKGGKALSRGGCTEWKEGGWEPALRTGRGGGREVDEGLSEALGGEGFRALPVGLKKLHGRRITAMPAAIKDIKTGRVSQKKGRKLMGGRRKRG